MSAIEDIDLALAGFAIEAGFPHKRQQLAARLLESGLTADDVLLLGKDCESTVEGAGNATRVLYSRLQKPELLPERIADLRKCAGVREARQSPKEPYFGETYWQHPGLAPLDQERLQSFAYVRLRVECIPLEQVATELNVTCPQVKALADAELVQRSKDARAVIRKSTDPKVVAAEIAQRRDEVRRALAGRKVSAEADAMVKLAEKIRKIPFAKERLVHQIKAEGRINLGLVLSDKVQQGAFAELEAAGLAQTFGDIDDHGFIKCRMIFDPKAQERLVADRKAFFIREMTDLSTPAARAAARRAAEHGR